MTEKNSSHKLLTVLICTFAIAFGLFFKLLPAFFFWQGHNYLKNQDYVKAYYYLKNAYNFDRQNKDYRYYYVQTLTNLTPTVKVQKSIFEISESKQDDSARMLAKSEISKWQNNILKNIGGNYIEQVPLDRKIIRWDEETFPLQIVIKDKSDIELPPYYRVEILRAFAQWQNASGFLKFQETKDAKNADIIVEITPLPPDLCKEEVCRYVVGYTTPKYKGSQLKNMTIVLYDKDPYGNYFSDKELFNTILHEIGHSLGIMGHSYSSEDLMYMSKEGNNFYSPYRSSFQYLSSKDINTIKLLYKLIPDITNTPINKINTKGLVYAPVVLGTSQEISSRKLEEAKNYIKNAPDIAGGYIDLGIAYAELNKKSEAEKAMNKALELAQSDNEKYIAFYNLSILYLNNKQLDKALEYANNAKNILNSEEIKELITNINHAKSSKKKPFAGNNFTK